MEGRASSFPGTKNTERSMKKRCCITLIQVRKEENLNINRNQSNRKLAALNQHRIRARKPFRGNISPWMNKEEEKVLEAATLPVLNKGDRTSLPVGPTVMAKPVSTAIPIIPTILNQEKTITNTVILAVLNKDEMAA